jgi:hypothetical protein
MARLLIVNADDLGYDPEIDRGILEAHARGIVTSATAMVTTPFAPAALRSAPATLAIGLHLVLDPTDGPTDVARKLEEQLDGFAQLAGRPPTHIDGHKHLHATAAALPVVAAIAAARGMPVRALDALTRTALRAASVRTADHFLGDASLRPCWTADRLRAALLALPDGLTELMCHPGYRPSHAKTSFGAERETELAALCDPGARAALVERGIGLINYGDGP